MTKYVAVIAYEDANGRGISHRSLMAESEADALRRVRALLAEWEPDKEMTCCVLWTAEEFRRNAETLLDAEPPAPWQRVSLN